MKFIKDILDDIKEGNNIDSYVTLILGIFCSFIGIFDVSTKYVFAAISLVLTFLALGTLIDRKNTKILSKLIQKLDHKNTKTLAIREKKFFLENITESIENATQEILFILRSGGTIKNIDEELKDAIERGCKVRIILCARSSNMINSMSFRGHRTTEPPLILSEINNSIANLKSFREKITNKQKYLLEVREIEYIPPIGISIADPNLKSGKLFALLVSFRSHSRTGASIKLDKENDSDLFDYFTDQFTNYWNAAKKIKELE